MNTSPRISPDGTRLAYLAPSGRGVLNVWIRPLDKDEGAASFFSSGTNGWPTARLVRLDAAVGKEIEVIATDPRCDIWKDDVLVDLKQGTVQAYAVDHLKREWKVLDPAISRDFALLREFRKGSFHVVSRDVKDAKWIVTFETDDGPSATYLYDRTSGDLRFLFDDRPALKEYTLASMKPVVVTARDGLKLVSYLTLPVGIAPRGLPKVLCVHGGPTARDEWGYEPFVQLLANRGYAVLQVNFRGSVGFGKAFQRAGDGQIGVGSMQHDLTDAVKWAIRQGIADPGRIGIFGVSYGGYATLAGLAFTPELYACGAEGCGPSSIKTMLQSIPPYYGPLKNLFVRIFGAAESDEAYNRKVSPLHNADKIKAPLFVAQGVNDPRCRIRESDQIVKALRDRNLPVTFVVYADEGHGFRRPENNMDFHGRVEEFLAGHLGGRSEPLRRIEGSTAELR